MSDIFKQRLQCSVCGHEWGNRSGVNPRRCPNSACRSTKWGIGRAVSMRGDYLTLEVGKSVIIPWVISPKTGVPDVDAGNRINKALNTFEKRTGRQFWRQGLGMRGLWLKRVK